MTIWRLAGVAVLGLGLGFGFSGCVNNTALDDLRDTKPEGSAFNKALFKDYSALARSFGEVGAAAGVAFDTSGSFELTEMDSNVGALANAYAEKALLAARGSLVEPEPGVDVPTHKARDRLIRALERGKEIESDLNALLKNKRLRGIRRLIQNQPDPDFCIQPKFIEGLKLLAGSAMHVFHFNDYPAAPPRQHRSLLERFLRIGHDQSFVENQFLPETMTNRARARR